MQALPEVHKHEGSFLAHTQWKKHQINSTRQAAKFAKKAKKGKEAPAQLAPVNITMEVKKFVKATK